MVPILHRRAPDFHEPIFPSTLVSRDRNSAGYRDKASEYLGHSMCERPAPRSRIESGLARSGNRGAGYTAPILRFSAEWKLRGCNVIVAAADKAGHRPAPV